MEYPGREDTEGRPEKAKRSFLALQHPRLPSSILPAMSHIKLSDGRELHFYIPPPEAGDRVEWWVRSIVRQNPFRLLGIAVNAPQKEQLANMSRMAAFLRVKREVSFPSDAIAGLGRPGRSEESVARAGAELSQPAHRLRHAPFWFFRHTPQDAAAWEKLQAGELEAAEHIWREAPGLSARHNLALCLFLSKRAEEGLALLEELYADNAAALGQLVDASLAPTEEDWVDSVLSAALGEAEWVLSLMSDWVRRPAWRAWLSRYAERALERMLEDCKACEGEEARFRKAKRCDGECYSLLGILKRCCGEEDPGYTSMADRMATEMLLAAIGWFNCEKMSYTLAVEVESLMRSAREMACDEALRRRCEENRRTVAQARMELPTDELGEEGRAIYARVRGLLREKKELASVRLMLQAVQPRLRGLRKKFGAQHAEYLKLSTMAVRYAQNAMAVVLARAANELTAAQERMEAEQAHFNRKAINPHFASLSPAGKDFDAARRHLLTCLRESWAILRELDFYDMEPKFRQGEYAEGRATVEKLCRRASIQTDYAMDTLRRHPGLWAVIALAVLALIGGIFWGMNLAQKQTQQLGSLMQQAQSRADWEAVAAAAQEKSMASNRYTVLSRAQEELRRLDEAEKKRQARVAELEEFLDGARAQGPLEHFLRLAAEYTEEYGEQAGERVPELVKEAEQRLRELREGELQLRLNACCTVEDCERLLTAVDSYTADCGENTRVSELRQRAEARMAELREEQKRRQVEALLEQYQRAETFAELEAFVSAAAGLRAQDEELERCCVAATGRAAEGRAACEAALRTRFEQAKTAAQLETVAQEARNLAPAIPALEALAQEAADAAARQRLREQKAEEEKRWGTEARAWATVQQENTAAACREYLKRYPKGRHAREAGKRVIDAEVDEVFAKGRYGRLPLAERTKANRSATAKVSITNDTPHTLTLLYSGKRSDKLVIPPHATRSLSLPADTYRVVASVDARGVLPFAGTETYQGGSYEASYYISTSPAPRYEWRPRNSGYHYNF